MNIRSALLAALMLAASAAASAQSPTPSSPAPLPDPGARGMRMVWSEEFNGRDIDPDIWNFERGFVRNNELQWYQPDNAAVRGGRLRLRARHERVENPGYDSLSTDWTKNRPAADYTSASLTTRGKMDFTYGILKVRAKVPVEAGSWPAIWMVGYYPWPTSGEIDIMELYPVGGKPSFLANAAWCGDEHRSALWDSATVPLEQFTAADPRWVSRYHVWTMDWTPEYIRIYIDDTLVNDIDLSKTVNGAGAGNQSGVNPFTQPHYVLLNLAVGSKGGTPDPAVYPAEYDIDYVRLYQRPDATNVSTPRRRRR